MRIVVEDFDRTGYGTFVGEDAGAAVEQVCEAEVKPRPDQDR